MPRDLSVNEPKRSFCPSCKYQIPWHANLPLVTWLVQRGKCANCKSPIAFRYFAVELLTGLLFLAVWLQKGAPGLIVWLQHERNPALWSVVFGLWVFLSLLIVATFIDFEFFIIPDEITIGGAVAGIVFSAATPLLHGTTSHLEGILASLLGAGIGFALLWLISVGGKLAFGKKEEKFAPPVDFTWNLKGESAVLVMGNKTENWMDLFTSETDFLFMDCASATVAGIEHKDIILRSQYETLYVGEEKFPLNDLKEFSGTIKSLSFKREAMGFGDVKFIACIGAFLGWQATLATVMMASIAGSIVGITSIALGRREWSAKIPFGPYLAFGALIWVFYGTPLLALWHAYYSGE